MKKTMLAIIFVLFLSGNVSAGNKNPTYYDFCKELSDVSNLIMYARQVGIPITTILDDIRKQDVRHQNYMIPIVYTAYKHPRHDSEEYIMELRTEFANNVFVDCISANPKW